MKTETITCDISDRNHSKKVETVTLQVIFDHDQEDGKSRCEPYLSTVTIDICETCKKIMLNDRKYIYAYGAMGHNKYTL
jgi:hypothetical protein